MVLYALVKLTLEWLISIRSTWFLGILVNDFFFRKTKSNGISFNLRNEKITKQFSSFGTDKHANWTAEYTMKTWTEPFFLQLTLYWGTLCVCCDEIAPFFPMTFEQHMLRASMCVFVFCCQLYVVSFGVRSMLHAHTNGLFSCFECSNCTFRIPVHR